MRTRPAGFAKGSTFGGGGISQSEMTEGVRPGSRPSPSRLRRATSPERERLWQGQKVCSLTVGFFLPLTNEDETCPLCQGLHLRGRWHFAKRNDGRGSSALFAKGSPFERLPPAGGRCRRRRRRGFVPHTKTWPVWMHRPCEKFFIPLFPKKRAVSPKLLTASTAGDPGRYL